jgi:F-type H+-transporting ATPase subunit epsilon
VVGLATKTAFRIILLTPRARLLDCRAGGVVIPCSDGQRGILRNHCPLLTGLSQGIMHVRDIPDRADAFYVLEGGFARFSENHLTVLAYDAITFDGLTPEKIKDMISRAQNAVLSQELIKSQAQRVDMARNRLIVRMAEMATLITPTVS